MSKTQRVMIVAGEASGDSHAAKLVSALKEFSPDISFEFFGATGLKMRDAGVETIIAADQLAIMGLPEIAKAVPMFWRVFKILIKEANNRKPDVVVLVDFPEFNLKLAKSLKKNGLRVVYYISPQLWAWRKYRARGIEKNVDLLLTILPFEKDWYLEMGIQHVKYIGNPLAGEVKAKLSKKEFCVKHGLDNKRPIIALLAGSRRKEISRILPVLLETAALMETKEPGLQFINAIAATREISEVEEIMQFVEKRGVRLPKSFLTIKDETYDALEASDAAAVASGTATLETAIIGTPLAVVYKSSSINWHIFRPMISVEHFGLVNLIAQNRLAKELLQYDLTASALAGELFRLLEPNVNSAMREELAKVKESLGQKGASARAAEAIIALISSSEN